MQNKSDTNNIIPYAAYFVNTNSGNNLNNNEVLKGYIEENVYKNNSNLNKYNNEEQEINSEYLKPIELPEELQEPDNGTPSGGAADIEEIFETETDRIHEFAQKYSDPLFIEDLYSTIGLNGSLKDLKIKIVGFILQKTISLNRVSGITARALRGISH